MAPHKKASAKPVTKSTKTKPTAARSRDESATTITTRPNKPTRSRASRRASSTQQPFWQRQFTIESIYWVLLGLLIIAMALWIATLQIRLDSLYDQMSATRTAIEGRMQREPNRPPVVNP